MALDVHELNAFDHLVRFRLIRRLGGDWPSTEAAQAALTMIETRIRAVLEPRLLARVVTPASALSLHRHTRWILFARLFATDVDYLVEDR